MWVPSPDRRAQNLLFLDVIRNIRELVVDGDWVSIKVEAGEEGANVGLYLRVPAVDSQAVQGSLLRRGDSSDPVVRSINMYASTCRLPPTSHCPRTTLESQNSKDWMR